MTKKIEFTNNALEQIKKIVSKNKKCNYFRISVKGGGCSGFKYNFELDNNINKDDHVFEYTIIDSNSLSIIDGSIVDYKKEMVGSSFVIENPKASSSCGCGLSFSV